MSTNLTVVPAARQGFSDAKSPYSSLKTHENAAPVDFETAEPIAFAYATKALRRMPGCSKEDLAQAAKSYFYESLRAQGAAHLFREAYVEAKAERMGDWWYDKHQRSKKRSHTKYTPEAAKRGGQTRGKQRAAEADRHAYFAQDWKAKGWSIERIAAKLDAGISTVYRLLKRVVSPWFGQVGKVVSSKFSQGKDSNPSTIQLFEDRTALPCEKANPPPESEALIRALREYAELGKRDFAAIGREKGLRVAP